MIGFKKNLKLLAIAISLFLFSSLKVYASSATIGFNSESRVIIDKEITVSLYVYNINDVEGGISTIGGNLVFDSDYLQYISGTGVNTPFPTIINPSSSYSVAGMPNGSTITSNTTLLTIKFKALKEGTTSISFKNGYFGDENGNRITADVVSKNITITSPPSTNTFLSNLSLSTGSLNFSKDITNYSLQVESDVTSITINATAEDAGAKVSGIGTKTLNYGDNKISIVVTAPSGDTKTYTININRKDMRSNNNKLASLKLSTGSLNPSFNSERLTYNVTVPYDVSSIKVTATVEDSKSKVTINGGSNLKAGKVNNVTITVTAETGSPKTYTIKVTREKDPNAQVEKNKNNNLASLKLADDITISPQFNKNTTSYSVEVPYRIKSLNIEAIPEDEAYAKVNINGAENLQVGENEVKIIVTAEDGTSKEYTLKVTRLEGTPEEIENENSSDNKEVTAEVMPHLLKSINLTKGKLTSKFDSNKFVYYYKKNNGFKIEGIPNNAEEKVTIFEHNDVITIIVGENLEESNIYTFIPKKSNAVVIVITICSTLTISGGTFIGYKGLKRFKRKNKEVELPDFTNKA